MAIRFIEANPEPKRVVRTRSVTAPLDSRIANDVSQKSSEFRDAFRDMPNRGRPPINGAAMTAAERQRRRRERLKARAVEGVA